MLYLLNLKERWPRKGLNVSVTVSVYQKIYKEPLIFVPKGRCDFPQLQVETRGNVGIDKQDRLCQLRYLTYKVKNELCCSIFHDKKVI